ncbi:MAG: DUF721 domain-containing protein [Lentisphaeria bacterium]|nr:DUF721 domain-containing protein [Lentisphaeria bacterium]
MKKFSPEPGFSTDPLPARQYALRRRRMELLTLWYGRERAAAEISCHTRQPQEISVLINDVLSNIKRPENGILIKLRADWGKLIGSGFSRYTEPVALKNGVLTLKVKHSALLMELQPSLDLIQDRINRELGENTCQDIKLTVG